MRYEDASGAFQASGPIANDDADTLSAGQRGPATGNLITGEGTQYASAGADSAAGAHITAIAGKGGEDTSFSGGKLSIAGEHGRLTVDADGNYSYLANGNVENVRDRFTYTLADSQGNSDTAALIVEIGKTPAVIKANAQQVIVGPDGVVTLPPGVELSDVRVVGRNLVVDLPDGSQMIIIDGAIFVPQLVLGGVEVPATNVAALLIGQEPQPAAGELPPSSGGNFALPPPPLDPGIPLGDLIPPTELDYIPPEPEEVFDTLDDEPEAGAVSAQLDDDARPGGIAGGTGDDPDSVNVNGFLPGSGGDGDLTWSLLLTGAPAGFTYVDGPGESILVQQSGVTVLTITVNPATGEYSIVQNATIDHPAGDNENNVSFTIEYAVTDEDGDVALGTLDINVDDDTPTVDATVASDANVLLTTQDAQTDGDPTETDTASTTADFGGIFGASGAFGADGPGTSLLAYALSTTGGASGLTQHGAAINLYLIGGVVVGSTAASAGAVNASNTVFDISVDGAGVVTLNQYSQIDHTNTDPSPTGPGYEDHLITLADGSVTLTLTASVTDSDGDTVTDTASVGIGANMQFADDGPSIDPTLNEVGGAVVDESEPVEAATIALVGGYTRGDDPHLAGGLAIGKGSTSGPVIDANAIFGADGPANGGGISYQLEVGNLVSGLTTTEGTAINLVELANGVVIGVVDGTTTVAFAIAIDSNTGVVTVEQYLSLFHPDSPSNFDEPVFLNEGSLGVTVTATDFDGDSVTSEAVDITSLIRFEDDGPDLSNLQPGSGVTLDETTAVTPAGFPISGTSAAAMISATQVFGADGPADSGSAVFGLSLTGDVSSLASGLATAIGDHAITLVQIDADTIQGQYNDGGVQVAFTIQMNANGTVTLTQNVPLEHLVDGNTPPDYDDSLNLSGLVNATLTITDGDGDQDSGAAGIGGNLVFKDDGPSIDVTAGADGAVVLQTQDPDTIGGASDADQSTANFSGVFGLSFAAGADGGAAPALDYSLGISAPGADSGLDQGGNTIFLYLIGGVVVGSTSATQGGVNAGNTVFDVTVNGSGVVTLTQYSQIDHPIGGDPSATGAPFADHIVSMADNLVTLTASSTVTDNDDDFASDSATVNIGANLRFGDDGPDVSAVLTGTLLKLDETDGVGVPGEVDAPGGNLGTITVAAATLFTVSQPHVSADAPTSLVYSLSLSADGAASGLLLSTTNAPIFLYNIGGVVTGSTSGTLAGVNASNTAFTVSINSGTGAVTMTQFLAVEHPTPGASHDEDSSAITSGVLSANVTATDFDGDTDTGSIDLGSIIRFEDDGPSIDVTVSTQVPEPNLLTQDTQTDGTPTTQDSASSAINFGGVFGLTSNAGSDGAASAPALSYLLGISAPGVDSGLSQGGVDIHLYLIGGVVVGSTSATLGGVNAGNTVFDVTVSSTGVVTLTQYSQIDHPIGGDPSATGAPFEDHILSMTDSLVTLTASSTITDNDGDTASDSVTINIGANLQFADDGPDVAAVLTGTLLKLDETDGVGVPGEVDAPGGPLGTITVNAAVLVNVTQPNISADTPTTLAYSLVLSSEGVASGLLVSSNNAPIFLYENGGVITGSTSATEGGINAGNTAFVISINSGTGAVTMTQFLAVEHPTPGLSHDEDSNPFTAGVLNLRVTATDFDGDTDFAQVDLGSVIRFEDDGPSAQNDVDVIVGGNGPATGNVLTGVEIAVPEDGNAQDGVADNVGSDTPGTVTFIASNNVPANTDGTYTAGNLVVNGQYGTLTINANGDYSYLRTSVAGGVQDVFTYTLTDADGDTVTATLTISIEDNFPVLPDPALIRLDDDVIPAAGGNLNGPGDDDPDTVPGNVVNGQLNGSGGDAPLTYNFTGINTLPLGFSIGAGSDADTLLINQGSTLVMTIQLNQATGAFTVTQNAPMLHPADNGGPDDNIENNFVFSIGVEVEDLDNDAEPATITINVDDDTPTIDVTQTNEGSVLLTTQDAQTDGVPTNEDTDSSSANFGGVFGLTSSAGADGGASPTLGFALAVSNSVSGFTSHGVAVNLFLIGNVVVGSTALNAGSVDLGNTIFTISVSGTGVVTLTQYQQVDHPIAGDPTPTGTPFEDHLAVLANGKVTLTASSTITDGDGDLATDQEVVDLGGNIRFADDGPVAANDVVNQPTENQPVTFGVFGNDQFGADGVDTDNNPTVNVTFTQPPPGQGTVSYNAATGQFTFTPAPGQEGSTQFTYTIIDFDGDTSTATVTINLQPDSTPSAVDGVAKVDDDGLPAGVGDNASGDLDANSGEAVVVNPSEAIWHGQLVATAGGDTIVDYDFSSMHGTSGSVGTETVNYTWNNGTSTLTATISGGARNGLELFNVVVNQGNGSYNLTLVRPVAHVDEVANQENDATTNLTFTVTDSDGDTDTGLVTVTFDDDMPVVTDVTDPLEIPNSGPTPSGTGNFAFDIGADQNADFDDINVSNFTILINGDPATNVVLTPNVDGSGNPAPETATTASYRFTFQYDTGVGGLTNGVGTLVFNKATGEYTVTLTSGPIEGFTILETGSDTTTFVEFDLNGGAPDVVTAQLATNLFAQFTAESTNNNSTPNLLTTGGNNTAWNPGELFTADPGNPQVSSTDAGVDGNTMDTGEVLDFNLFTSDPGSNTALTPDGFATEMFIQFFQFTASDDIIVILKLQDADNPLITTTRAIIIDGDDVFLDGDSAAGTSYEGLVNGLGSQDALVVIQSNDYNAAGENWVIVGAQIVTDNDGTSGTGVNLDGDLGLSGASDRDQDGDFDTDSGNAALDELSTFADDTDVSGLKITSIGFLVPSTEAQSATIEFDVTIEDSDGDQVVTQDITVQIGDPVVTLAAESTSFSTQSVSRTAANDDFSSLLAGDTSQKWNGGGNSFGNIGNTGITSAMVAASGLSLMSTTSLHGFNEPSFDAMMQDSFQQLSAQIVGREGMDDGLISAMSFGGGYEPTFDTVSLSGSGRGFNEPGTVSNMLDSQAFGDAAPAYQPTYAVNQVADFGSASFAAPAPVVGMPSAQALQLAGLDGNVQNGGAIEQVLADALGGAPTLDAILANLPGGIGELAAIANLASPDGQAVPGWDMALNGAFGSGAEMVFKADAVALHHDAVQPIA